MQSQSTQKRPQVHGHRGARGRLPENTLEAVSFAIECGADAAEVDLNMTKDDIVVVHHDLTLNPNTTLRGDNSRPNSDTPIRSLTFNELQRYDVGSLLPSSDYAQHFNEQRAIKNAKVPSIDQFIEHVLAHATDDFIFNLELKSAPNIPELMADPEFFTAKVLDAINHYDIAHRTFVQSFDWRLVRMLKTACPTLIAGLLTDMQVNGAPRIPQAGMKSLWTDSLDLADFDGSVPQMVASTGADVWSSNFQDLTPALITESNNLGLQIYTWTVNEVEDMQRMIDWGVNTITTDYPDDLVKLLSSKP